MDRKKILSKILEAKLVAIVRLQESGQVQEVSNAILSGGIGTIEVTIGTPNVYEEISKLSEVQGVMPGVGSVVNVEQVEQAVAAGAQFIVTPTTKKEVIEKSHALGKPIFSGAFTPTEVLQAYEWGADVVKLFPAGVLGLPYFKAVKAPMPYIPLMPTGGVNVENAAAWIKSGAICLGIGSTLVNAGLIANNDFNRITEIAKQLKAAVASAQ